MYDETQLKIIDATMTLIIEKGYSGATTKNIAKLAGVNESIIFRRFDGKKEIVIAAMELPKWNPGLSESDFTYHGDLEEDLTSFSRIYMSKVTPQMVKVSIGLRSAELEGAALPGIMKVPMVFKKVLMNYFTQMIANGNKQCFWRNVYYIVAAIYIQKSEYNIGIDINIAMTIRTIFTILITVLRCLFLTVDCSLRTDNISAIRCSSNSSFLSFVSS